MKTEIQAALQSRLDETSAAKGRQKFHLMADIGWISDPNGLCDHNGTIHICHQYTPAADLGLSKSWGHYTTRDWIHYIDQGTLMVPDQPIDKDGCYSGSALSWKGKLHLFYTGNILSFGDFDYIYSGRGHYTNHLESTDGLHFSPKEVLLRNEDYPADMSCHVRDPKLTVVKGRPWMVLGARTRKDVGCALLYQADPDNLCHLEYVQTIHSPEKFGYMWECPGLIANGDDLYLMACPQGVPRQGYKYENVYQNGLFRLSQDKTNQWIAKDFQTLDYGFDFYAPQSFVDHHGREIVIGWMGIPDAPYDNPEKEQNWVHCLSLPRTIRFENGRVFQYPVEEILTLKDVEKPICIRKKARVLNTRTFALKLNPENRPFVLRLRHDLEAAYDEKLFTLRFSDPDGSGKGRTARHIELDSCMELEIFSDESSVEIFLNHGQYVLSSRVYDQDQKLFLQADRPLYGTLAQMNPIEIDYSPALGPEKPTLAVEVPLSTSSQA
ncbi:glycoside hydrolase family 32 protein [Erysipelotrichaceae bacterium 51-3]